MNHLLRAAFRNFARNGLTCEKAAFDIPKPQHRREGYGLDRSMDWDAGIYEHAVDFAKLLLAVICGGVIGSERERKGRPAGFRTHILVCLGSALAMMTNAYIVRVYGGADPARLGAAGNQRHRVPGGGHHHRYGEAQVKGLTTRRGYGHPPAWGSQSASGFIRGLCSHAFLSGLLR
jgi:hypothetical protein